jgi:uncharacterized NAD(P)/FAD-binding protein YdhS
MKSECAADVVIIGGGYSGTMLAAELARRSVSSVLVEGGGRAGRGTAYSTAEDAHLLNVTAGRMSAWADQPGHFEQAVRAEGFKPDDFVPRRRYGEYLRGILDEAVASGLVTIAEGEAIDTSRDGGGWTASLADGRICRARAIALAQGNQPPGTPAFARGVSDKLFIKDPWSDAGRAAVTRAASSGGDVLIVGTGLTMVDVVLSLDEARHRGRIVALSRRGLSPRAHAVPSTSSGQARGPAPVDLDDVPQASLMALWRWLRRRSAEVGWRAAMDSLRSYNQLLWQALDMREQRRFLRHVRPWWDVHRHRIAPQVAARIERLVQAGRLEIVAGRVVDMWEEDGWLGVRLARRRKPLTPLASGESFALAVNCTGPLGSIADSADPVLRGLFGAGLARADRLGMGIEVEGRSRVVGADRAWAVGPLTKGAYWEIVAVPDIREQVADVASDIAEELADDLQP